jgi:2-polyprenyl-3-methyl-5-hydroxy-6-metoxy-1,4-benzoquinol methylase
VKIIKLLKKVDEQIVRIKNKRLLKAYTFLRHLLARPFKRPFITNNIPTSSNMQIIRTLDELDDVLLSLDVAQKVSDDELRKLFPTFRMEFNTQIPGDPYSDEYVKAQFELYHKIAGKDYSVDNEKSAFDLETATIRPFPYYTGSCETVGNHLTALSHVIRSMDLKSGAKIVEFGPGWGNITLALAMMGFDVIAVDIEKNFCNLINKRAEQAGVKINVVNADFSWIEQIREPVDAVLFFECFHHCSDHLRLIKNLDKAVKDNGKVYFAAEPITSDFPIPWGLRLDGESLWAIRKMGWLELGFSEQYFIQTLTKYNWILQKKVSASLPWVTVFEATKNKNI